MHLRRLHSDHFTRLRLNVRRHQLQALLVVADPAISVVAYSRGLQLAFVGHELTVARYGQVAPQAVCSGARGYLASEREEERVLEARQYRLSVCYALTYFLQQ